MTTKGKEKSMFRRISSAFERIKQLYLDGSNRWITDNYYLISRNFDGLKKSRDIIARNGDMLEICEKYCKKHSFVLEMEKLCAFFSSLPSNTKLGYEKLSCVPIFLSAAAIIQIAKSENPGPAIGLLRKLGSEDFEMFVECVSPAERLLEAEYSGEYKLMDSATKSAYRKRLENIAHKRGTTYNDEAARLSALSHEKQTHIGFLLFPKQSTKKMYFVIKAAIFVLLFILCNYFCGLYSLLAILPLYKSADIVADFFYSLLTRVKKASLPVFRLESEYVKDKTLVLITSLLFGGVKDEDLFKRLERFYLSNRKDNHIFGILGDFKDGSDPEKPEDKTVIENAKAEISRLNQKYGSHFVLLARSRVKNADGLYGGRERKRGAVTDAVRFLGGENGVIEYFEGDRASLDGVKYLFTLDADTNLCLGAVSELLCAAVHPLAKPKIEYGRVVSGWGLFQPAITVSLESASKTAFSRLLGGSGGIDAYQSAAYDKYQTVLGEGVFCGKGLFDVECFRELVIPKIPNGFVLSHDLPEGAILRTRLVSDVTLSDSAPKSVLSYYGRAARWIRGDVQNLKLLKTIKSPAGRFMILQNVFGVILPIFQLIAILVAFGLSVFGVINQEITALLLLFLLSCTLLPPILGIIGTPSRLFWQPKRRFFSKISHSLGRDLSRLAFELSALAYTAQVTTIATLRSVYRLVISKKKLLEWVTAGEGEQSGSFLVYSTKMLPSAIVGIIMFFFAPFWAFKLLGLAWFWFPVTAFLLSKEKVSDGKHITAKQKTFLIEQASLMWGFFSKYVCAETNHLPPDNVQFEPVFARADRTSPTNIGMYLLSCLAAADFGFISTDELNDRLSATLQTLNKLDKWNGHLYNWYTTDTLNVIGNAYVSTVDSGNFITAVLSLVEGLREYGFNTLADGYVPLTNADFSLLYNTKRNLFSLGREWANTSGANSDICYDLYMSEARTTSYYALAKGIVPKKHWGRLSRTLISSGGYIGMASWTGTTFEYFMPPLLLPVYKNSFEYESLRFAFEQQRKKATGVDGVWGISESAFFSFDSEMNYQYKALGVQKLGLKRYLEEESVVSPYSSFLMLRANIGACIANLIKLKKYGMLGEYGYYEACDFTPTRVGAKTADKSKSFAVIKSYMAHHVGMSITAAANACFADVFVRRFMRNPEMSAVYELLQEKVPDVSIYKDIAPEAQAVKPQSHAQIEGTITKYSLREPEIRLLNTGRLTMLIGDLGHISLRFNKNIINECDFDLFSDRKGMSVKLSGRTFVPTCTPEDEKASFTVEEKDGTVSHIRSSSEFSGRARYSVVGKCIKIETLAPERENYSAELEFPIALDDERAFMAHPSFSKLSVSAEYLADEKIILFTRKPKGKTRPPFLAVALTDKAIMFRYDTRLVDINELQSPLQERTGAAVNPYLRIQTEAVPGGRTGFLIACAMSRDEVLGAIKNSRLNGNADKKSYKQQLFKPKDLSKVLGAIFFSTSKPEPEKHLDGDIHSLWRYGISGDYPLLLVDTNDDSTIYDSLLIFRTLTIASVRCEMLIVVREADRYQRESRRGALKAISLTHCEAFVGKRGGIYIIDYEDLAVDYDFICANSVDLLSLPDRIEGEDNSLPKLVSNITASSDNDFVVDFIKVKGGGFDKEGGFIVDKSQQIPLEWSYITANRSFGSAQTQNSLGYTYFRNASKYRITEFTNNAYFYNRGERLLFFVDGTAYDLCAVSSSVRYGDGKVIWRGKVNNIYYELTLFVCERLPMKFLHLKWLGTEKATTALVLRPDGGVLTEIVQSETDHKAACFRNLRRFTTSRSKGAVGFAGVVLSGALMAESAFSADYAGLFGNKTGRRDCVAITTTDADSWFYVGATPNYEAAERIIGLITPEFAVQQKQKAEESYKNLLPQRKEGLPAEYDLLYNTFLPYQTTISRFYARSAYYQVGGAYGFRDQLQDCLMLTKTLPELVRTHIIRCCAHQYDDGSVQHWWHPPREGVRTKSSDDFLWLPIVCARFIRDTGDESVLDIKTRWLVSPPLRDDETERYEFASASDIKDDVYTHCVRAIERGMQFGKHGLSLMGSCDWNDGFSELGASGKGESIFTAWLFIWAVREFGPIIEKRGDDEVLRRYKKAASSVLGAIESYCFEGDRYIRAITDNGEILGAPGTGEAEIDILPQCMPAIVGGADSERLDIALDMAFSLCFDPQWQIMKLFTPPFDKDQRKIGYIQSYVPGIRENGGQYTHAAVWMAMGLYRAGKKDKAKEAANALNPIIRCRDKRLAEAYKIEPFVLSGDVYSNPSHPGRGGWSWYTGAAAWYWQLIDEMFE